MPKQNRVNPFGDIVAVSERGTMMGNRGSLHDESGQIRRAWEVKRWLICRLEFLGRHRIIMAPNRYTELFFLDEATALAAGHRPCSECRRESFRQYTTAWVAAHHDTLGDSRPTADGIDNRLHSERIGPDRRRLWFVTVIDNLPDGVVVSLDGSDSHLIWKQQLLEWSPGGYTLGRLLAAGARVRVLTPRSSVETIRAGYVPDVHPSAHRISKSTGPLGSNDSAHSGSYTT